MKTVTPREALQAVGSGRRIIISPGCGEPGTLVQAIASDADAIAGSTLYSGLLLGDYPFLDVVRDGTVGYGSWHVMPPVRRLVADGTVEFFPVRGSQVPALLHHLDVDVAFVRVSPPDPHGFCNLGPSVSYPLTAIRLAELVVAEIDESLPRLNGEGAIHVSEIDLAVESTTPVPEYPRAEVDETSRAIAKNLIELLPDRPTIQIGIGGIPEAFVEELQSSGIEGLRFAGMAIDGMVDLAEAGLIDREELFPYPPMLCAELMGTRRLMEFADGNPLLATCGAPIGINAATLGRIDRFVSINSAIEIDSLGQVNSEVVGGRQLSGVGGSVDFIDAANQSRGGRMIIALAATNVRDASSKIVRSLSGSTPVTIPRHSVEYVVTEHGVAHLAFASVRERAEALAEVADPEHRAAIVGEAALR